MREALIVAGFGTLAAPDGLAIIARALEEAFPECAVRRAVLSETIRVQLNARGVRADGLAEAVSRLRGEGAGRIAVAAAFVVAGREYARLRREAAGMRVSEPLLARESDLYWMAGLLAEIAREEGRTLLVMGHGADGGDAAYARLSERLPGNVRIACATGAGSFVAQLREWEADASREVTLMPLMLTAGWHARRQMAGSSADSWQSRLEARGFDVRVRMQGLAELPEVRQRFVEKAKDALERGDG